MTWSDQFSVNDASFAGIKHQDLKKPCQDFVSTVKGDYFIAGVVCDGCGGAGHSEIGAKFQADVLMRAIREQIVIANFLPSKQVTRRGKVSRWRDPEPRGEIEIFLRCVFFDLYLKMQGYVSKMVSPLTIDEQYDLVVGTLAATILGVVVTPKWTVIFNAGDGVYRLNDKEYWIETNDVSRYPVYDVVIRKSRAGDNLRQKVGDTWFEYYVERTERVDSLLIATDGAEPFLKKPDARLSIPDLEHVPANENVGHLDQFFDPYYHNAQRRQRLQQRIGHLVGVNRKVQRDTKYGPIPDTGFMDDLGLVVIKRYK